MGHNLSERAPPSGPPAGTPTDVIVRSEAHRFDLVTQRDHAALAGRLIEAWRTDDFCDRRSRPTVLLATREHDNGWREEDAEPMVDPAGRPYDFIAVPDAVKKRIWPRAVARLAALEPAAAALVAQHALRILRDRRGDPAWASFFTELETERDRLLRLTGQAGPAGRDAFLRDYRLVYLGDVLSLVFCNNWTRPLRVEGYEVRLAGTVLEVTPDPFDGAVIALSVPARRIPARPYPTDADLRTALETAAIVNLTGTCRGRPVT